MNSASIPPRAALPSAWHRQRACFFVIGALLTTVLHAQTAEPSGSDAPPENSSGSNATPPLPSPSDDPTDPVPVENAAADPGTPGGEPLPGGATPLPAPTPSVPLPPVGAAPLPEPPPPPLEAANTRRTWSNREGRTFVGELVSLEPPKVIFKRIDNRYFQLNLDQLAKGDVDWLARQQEMAQKANSSLVVPLDLTFRVVRRVETPGRLIDTGVVTPMGVRVQRRESPSHAVLMRGGSTGQLLWVPVAVDLYRIWHEGRDVSRAQLAFLLNTNEVDLAGTRPYSQTP